MSQAAVSIENAQLFEKAMSQKGDSEHACLDPESGDVIRRKGMLSGCNHDSWLEKYLVSPPRQLGLR